jgi:NADPH:quinone reductase-like Zn-dependent oxidoreductase
MALSGTDERVNGQVQSARSVEVDAVQAVVRSPPTPTAQEHAMKAIVQDRFGSPDVLELREIDKPQVGESEVLVRVRAASVNPADWYAMAGIPYVARPQMGLGKPKSNRLGVDLAGVVAAVGDDVTRFKAGDEVFGAGTGALAEYVAVPGDALVRKPANLSFEQAAAVPVAALTALQGLRDKGRLQPGQKVLINGASGRRRHLCGAARQVVRCRGDRGV